MTNDEVAGGEIDPFNATASILHRTPEGPVADHVRSSLQAAATRSDLIDIVTAQAQVNVTLIGAILAVWQHNDGELTNKVETLLEQSQLLAEKIGALTTRSLIDADPYVRRPLGNVE